MAPENVLELRAAGLGEAEVAAMLRLREGDAATYDALLRLDEVLAQRGGADMRGASAQAISQLPTYVFRGGKSHAGGGGGDGGGGGGGGATFATLPADDDEEAQLAFAIQQSLSEAPVAALAPAAAAAADAAAAAAAADASSEEQKSGFYCAICMSQFEPGTRVRLLPCFHSFW
jgi:hypothetical protein